MKNIWTKDKTEFENYCYVISPHNALEFIEKEIFPVLNQLNIGIINDVYNHIGSNSSYQFAMRAIDKCDFAIAIVNNMSHYVNFEIGLAVGK